MDRFSDACTDFEPTISTKKEVLYLPAPRNAYIDPCITINGQRINSVDRFTYLGSTLSRNGNVDTEIDIQIAKASASFGRLNSNVWNRRGITVETKLKVYRALVLPTLLYASETWTTYRRHLVKLNSFHLTCLRKILNIKWQDKIPDTEVLTRADLPSIHTIQMKW